MSVSAESDLIVKTLNGLIKGKYMATVFGKEVKVFHRIPFMKPPIGELRFKDPQPIDNWNDLLDCTTESPPTLNYDFFAKQIQGSEDALYINAYTKNTTPVILAPVMVCIHGGAFVTLSSTSDIFGPDYLLEKNIVFFSFNFRQGPFGFLSFEDPELGVPGNAGLKDQTMALKWIKRNAHVFGGDPNNITLLGISSGASSIHYHMISDLSKNLFHKAILISGVATNEWTIQFSSLDRSLALAKKLGWIANDGTRKALEILQNANGTEILKTVSTLIPLEEKWHIIDMNFVPSIEPYVAEQSFLATLPTEAMVNAWGNQIPIIVGSASSEGLIIFWIQPELQTSEKLYDSLGDFQNMVDIHLKLEKDSDEKKKFGAALKEIYFKNERPSLVNIHNYVKMIGDRYFLRGMHEMVKTRVNNPLSAPTYFNRFDFDDPFADTLKNNFGIKVSGVGHAFDTVYTFKAEWYHQAGGLKSESAALKTVQRMVGMYTTFAKTGNPNCSEIEPIYWEPIQSKTPPFKVLNISHELSFIDYPETDRLIAVDDLYKALTPHSNMT